MQNVFMNKAILLIVSIWLIGMTANAKEMVFPGDSLYEHGGSGSWGGVINLQESTTYKFPYSTSSEQNSLSSPCNPTLEWLISQLPTTTPANI